MSKNVKLVYGRRFIAPLGGIKDVLLKGQVVAVTDAQAAYLLTLEEKDRSNNIHKKFVVTDEVPTSENLDAMDERKRLALAARKEAEQATEDDEEETPKPKKRRAPRKPRDKKPATTESAE